MSSSAPSSRRRLTQTRRLRAFTTAFAIVLGVLVVIGLGGAALTTAQGPRVTAVDIDAAAAATSAGSRVIVTTTQSLATVSARQVTVSPSAPFTVDTSGRTVGVRFTLPLWDKTTYTVSIAGVRGLGGGPTAAITETFTTPALSVYLLQRSDAGDAIIRQGLAGDHATQVFTHDKIEDFRATSSHLVMSVRDAKGHSALIVTNLDGSHPRELALPGTGTVSNLQNADRGNIIGYTFTDADISATKGRESELFIASLSAADAAAAPQPLKIGGSDPRVDDWRFVPGTSSVLMLTFDGRLSLVSADGGDPVSLGNAVSIFGVARGATDALIERVDGPAVVHLATAKVSPLAPTEASLGQAGQITPMPTGGTLRALSQLQGLKVKSMDVALVGTDGTARTVFPVATKDTLIETCVSPSARYAAFLVAPDAANNPFDGYDLPLPQRVQTHIVDLTTGDEVSVLPGSDISWCQSAPRG